jgi:hypothetical protein
MIVLVLGIIRNKFEAVHFHDYILDISKIIKIIGWPYC